MLALLTNPLARWAAILGVALIVAWAYGLWRYEEGRAYERVLYERLLNAERARMAKAAEEASRKEEERLAAVAALETAQREFEDMVRGFDAVALPADLVRKIGQR